MCNGNFCLLFYFKQCQGFDFFDLEFKIGSLCLCGILHLQIFIWALYFNFKQHQRSNLSTATRCLIFVLSVFVDSVAV